MNHLAVANLLAGSKLKALHLLQRVLHMLVDAVGPDDEQSRMMREKITILERDESAAPTDESNGILPILETSDESISPNTSMSNTLKVWRERNDITDPYFL